MNRPPIDRSRRTRASNSAISCELGRSTEPAGPIDCCRRWIRRTRRSDAHVMPNSFTYTLHARPRGESLRFFRGRAAGLSAGQTPLSPSPCGHPHRHLETTTTDEQTVPRPADSERPGPRAAQAVFAGGFPYLQQPLAAEPDSVRVSATSRIGVTPSAVAEGTCASPATHRPPSRCQSTGRDPPGPTRQSGFSVLREKPLLQARLF